MFAPLLSILHGMHLRRPAFSVVTRLALTLSVIPVSVGIGLGGCTGSISGAGPGGGGGGGTTVGGPLLPARIRRLSNAEYDATVQALLGTTQTPSATFPPDAR